jgi:2-polyprenyl-3-methyl-5-hydroxy-6-metoxy-1,4-benzoquinol methylase
MFEKEGQRFVRCEGCGLERISPQPSDETLAQIYGEHYYDAWGLRENEALVANLKKRTFRYVLNKLGAAASGAKLLDCGAATGFLLEVAVELGYKPYALEFSEFAAASIAKKFGADSVFCGELPNAHFADTKPGEFQVVTMCDYIEHVRDPRQTLQLAHRWMAPGASLAITTPDAGAPSRRILGHGWTHYKIEHLFYFNKRNLEQLLLEVGFRSVRFFPLWKSLSLDYIGHQFEVYPHPTLTALARALRLLPDKMRSAPLPFTTGELLAVAQA